MPTIPKEKIVEFQAALLSNKDALEPYIKKRGFTEDTLIKFNLGWDEKIQRYTIPVYDETGNCVDIRRYKINPAEGEAKILSVKGYGGKRLYPLAVFSEVSTHPGATIVICEGEHDAIILNQHGIPAVTSTCGATSWDEEWNSYFLGMNVVLIFDCDKAGDAGAARVTKMLSGTAATVKRVGLGLEESEDITDFFVKYGRQVIDLEVLISEAKTIEEYKWVDLATGIDAVNYNKKLKFYGIIVGKDLAPYQIPKKVMGHCVGKQSGKACESCGIFNLGSSKIEKVYDFEADKSSLIKMMNTGESNVIGQIKKDLGIPPSSTCRQNYVEILERQNVEDVTVIPEINYEKLDSDYALRRAFYFGMDIKTNQSYVFRGTTVPDPITQMALYVVDKAESTKDSISRFILTPDIKDQLKIFTPENPKDVNSIWDKLLDISGQLSRHVTHIYKRDTLAISTLLCYHSVLSFNFCGEYIKKGWLEAAVVGDTESGKTKTIIELLKFFRLGEFITSGENSTVAGILGGLQQTHNKKWTVTWGKIPLNDRGLLVIDESDELAKLGIINLLSACRSEGVAELMKIQTQKTMARTRIIWVANPMHGRLNSYNFGIETIAELFKTQQDIRRLDFAVGCAKEEVPDSEINMRHVVEDELKYTAELFHASILRAWNMTTDRVKFTKEAEDAILQLSLEFGKRYSPDIPILLGSGARLKIARIAIALAALLYSTETGDDIIVTEQHATVAGLFLIKIYDGDPLSMNDFSKQKEMYAEIRGLGDLSLHFQRHEILNQLLHGNGMVMQDFEDIFGEDTHGAKRIVSLLRKNGALVKSYNYYKKTPAFITYLKERKKNLIRQEPLYGDKPEPSDA
jgi:hypothetical protein